MSADCKHRQYNDVHTVSLIICIHDNDCIKYNRYHQGYYGVSVDNYLIPITVIFLISIQTMVSMITIMIYIDDKRQGWTG